MRVILAGAAGAMIVSLAACGPGSAFDNGVRDQFKTTFVESCVAGARRSPLAGQIDPPRLCNCAIDRYMEGKTTEELRNMNPQDSALSRASEQCAAELLAAQSSGGGNESDDEPPAENSGEAARP